MKKVKIVDLPDGTRAPEAPWPAGTIVVRGDIEPGWYHCFEDGDEIPPPAIAPQEPQ